MKKNVLLSLIPFAISLICFAVLLVSAIIGSIKVGPESIVEKCEKAVKRGRLEDIKKLYEPNSLEIYEYDSAASLPYYGKNANFIFEGVTDDGAGGEYLTYAVVCEENDVTVTDFRVMLLTQVDGKYYIRSW